MRLFLVLIAPARARRPPRSPPGPPDRHHRSRLGRHALDGDRSTAPSTRTARSASYHFEYGTTTAYGLHDRRRGRRRRRRRRARSTAGARPGLSPSTTYHYRLVATNDDGGDRRAPTARSAPPPARALPGVSLHGRARGRADAARRCAAAIDPNGGETTLPLRVRHSPRATARARRSATRGAGDARRAVTEPIGGLQPVPPLPLPRRRDQRGRHARASGNRTFTTQPPADRRSRSSLDGAAHRLGRGARGLRHGLAAPASAASRSALERQDFPFAGAVLLDRHAGAGPRRPLRALPLLHPRAVLRHPLAGAHAHRRSVATSPTVDGAASALRVGIATRRGDAPRGADPRLGAARPRRTAAPCCSA